MQHPVPARRGRFDINFALCEGFHWTRHVGDGDDAFIEDGHVLNQTSHVDAFFDGDLVFDPVGQGDVAKIHALLEDQALAVPHQHAVLARVVALLNAEFAEEVVEGVVFRGGLGGADRGRERGFKRAPFGVEPASGLGDLLALLRESDFHSGLHDEPGEQSGTDRCETGQQDPEQRFHGVNVIWRGGLLLDSMGKHRLYN